MDKQEARNLYAHTTSLDSLKNMLNSGRIKSLRHIAVETPKKELSVEPLPMPVRFRMGAQKAYDLMRHLKEPDRIFLTRGGYLPNYGDVVITKSLGRSVAPHKSFNTIPNEYTTARALSLKNNANIYVPEESISEMKSAFPKYRFLSRERLGLKPYGLADRAEAFVNKMFLQSKEASEYGNTKYKRLFGTNARLVGSEALGINVPDSSDTDVFIPYKHKGYFNRKLERIRDKYPGLSLNEISKKRADKKTFTGLVDGNQMDVVVAYGDRAQRFANAFDKAKTLLTPQQQAKIVAEKLRLKNAWFFPETRYKFYKNRLAEELGLKEAYF